MTLMFYLGAGGLLGTGVLCFMNTSPYSRIGGDEYEKRKKRRLIGQVFFIMAVLFFGLAVLTQLASSVP